MSDTDYTTKSRKFHHLTEIQRGQIQAMLEMKVPKCLDSTTIKVHPDAAEAL